MPVLRFSGSLVSSRAVEGEPDKHQRVRRPLLQSCFPMNNPMARPLAEVDPEIFEAIRHETERQNSHLELIASENFTSEAVLEATGSVFTNKYAEGYPGKRYYGGCEFADVVENLARERAKKLFGAEYANVQPHSGSQANQAAYAAVLQPGDTILGMNLAHGGHLTHGHPLNFSGKTYKIVPYGVRRDDERIDYDELARTGRRAQAEDDHRRRQRLSAHPRFRRASARSPTPWARSSWSTWRISPDWWPPACIRIPASAPTSSPPPRTRRCADRARGMILAKEKYGAGHRQDRVPRNAGRTAGARHRGQGGLFPGSHAAGIRRVSAAGGGQRARAGPEADRRGLPHRLRRHRYALLLVDVFSKGVRGKEAEAALDRAHITANKNAIPFDTNPPINPSGMRLGSPGRYHARIRRAGDARSGCAVAEVLKHIEDEAVIAGVRQKVEALTTRFPLYNWKLDSVRA